METYEEGKKFYECIHCKHFWDCKEKKDKKDACIRFEQEKEEKNERD